VIGLLLSAGLVAFTGTQPQLAASGERVYVAFGTGRAIAVARSADGGGTFGEPVTIAVEGVMALGRHRGPRIAATPRALLVAAVVGARGGGADGDVVLYRSTDDGRTWSRPAIVNDVSGAAREGLHALAADASGLAVLAWLDLREKGTRIYAAVSRDHGVTWGPDTLVYASPSGNVCECCHPSVAIGAGGRIAVMFRNSLDGRRDLYVAESRDGVTFAPPAKQGHGSWTLEACPMDGGGVGLRGGVVSSVWRREDGIYTVSGPAAETRVGTGRDPALAQGDAGVDVAWSAAAGIELRQAGAPPKTLGPGQFPALLATRGGTVVAWEHDGRVQVQRVAR
jgi:BNR repeat protein